MENKFKKVGINFLLRDADVPYSIYLKLGSGATERMVKLYGEEFDNRQELIKIQNEKGLEFVYLEEKDYRKYLDKRKSEREYQLSKEEAPFKEKILNEFVADKKLLQELFFDIGLDKEKIEQVDKLNKKSLELIKQTKSLEDLYEMIKDNKNHSTVKNQFISYIMLNSLSHLEYSESSLEIVNAGLLLCDVTLSEEEYWTSFKPFKNNNGIPPKIKNHPNDVISFLPVDEVDNFFSSPLLKTLIKQHHEKPDGSGYPSGIDCSNISLVPAMYIIVEDLVSIFLKMDMKLNCTKEILRIINSRYRRYANTNFIKALKGLNAFYMEMGYDEN